MIKTRLDGKLVPITYDLITSLKIEGRYLESEKLMEKYYESIKKERKNDYLEELRKEKKVDRFKSKRKGICTVIGCNNKVLNNYSECVYHRRKRVEYEKRKMAESKKIKYLNCPHFRDGVCENKKENSEKYYCCNKCPARGKK